MPILDQGDAEVGARAEVARRPGDPVAERGEAVRAPTHLEQQDPVAAVEVGPVGSQRESALEEGEGLGLIPALPQDGRQIVAADGAGRLDLEGVAPQRLRVVPDPGLDPGREAEADDPAGNERDHERRDRRAEPAPAAGLHGPDHEGPDQEGEPGTRHVGVAVGSEMVAGVDDPAHRRQHHEIEGPGRETGRPSLPQEPDHGGRRHRPHRAQEIPLLEQAQPARQLVDRSQVERHEGLPGVEPDVVEDHHHPGRRLGIGEISGGPLDEERRRSGCGRQQHEWNLLAPDRPRGGGHPVAETGSEPAERVHVEDHQDQGQAHHDGLRGQGERGERQRGPPPARSHRGRPLVGPEVREKREEEEQPRRDIPPLGDPGHRFHAKRMDGEDERGRGRARARDERRGRGHRQREQAAGDEVEDRGAGRVQQQAREVIAERLHPPQRVVGAEGQPRRRDPVPHHVRGEHPAELRPSETPVVRVQEEVDRIVPVHPGGAEHGQEDRHRHQRDLDG